MVKTRAIPDQIVERRALAAAQGRRQARWGARLLAALVVLVVVAAVAVAGIGWYYSSQLLVPNHDSVYDLTVKASTPHTVTLPDTSNTHAVGRYAVVSATGRTVVGDISTEGGGFVTREVVEGSSPAAGTKVYWTPHPNETDPQGAAGLDFTPVNIPTDLGPMPAWDIPASAKAPAAARETTVILVHGRGASRTEGLRFMPTLSSLGVRMLDITYRNDVGAPESKDGFYHLGQTEYRDLDAAVGWALDHGAKRVVLYGWSMGGALVFDELRHGQHASAVAATVLDAPVVDWRSTLDLQAANRGLPGFLTPIAERIASLRAGIDWDDLDARHRRISVPTLLFHGTADTTVPIGPSREIAAANPSTITYVEVPGAEHTASWNVDPQGYEKHLDAFLTGVLHLR
ncbi:MAG: alpha/beta hydrolase family protein [Actinomycetes bacterium]